MRALVAAASTGLFVALAWNHPLFPWLVLGLGLALAAWAARDPGRAMAVLPALLPAVDLMPWTGWISFEEFDLAVLCVAAGGYARWAARRPLAPPAATAPLSASDAWGLKMLVLLSMAVALAVSMWRGFDGAGGFVWGWWQAYHEPMNSLRVAKSLWLALLLLPLWRAVQRIDPVRAAHDVSLGLSAGLLVVAVLTVWERWAYTGLLNFSSDYRTTALFWEMHVGGAALDGYLALTMPFAVREMFQPRGRVRAGLAMFGLAVGAYSCLTTFSRGVYAAVLIGMVLMVALETLKSHRIGLAGTAAAETAWRPALLLGIVFAGSAAWIFPTTGYRGLLALLGVHTLILPMAGWWRHLSARRWVAGLLVALGMGPLVVLAASLMPKGAYVVYAGLWVSGAGLLLTVRKVTARPRAPRANIAAAMMLGTLASLLVAMVLVGRNWGYEAGFRAMLPVAAILGLVSYWGATGAEPRWPASMRWQGALLASQLVFCLAVGVVLGGTYMGGRFATGSQDLEVRKQHWGRAFSQLRGVSDWAFGKGTGSYPGSQFLSGQASDQTGDYRLRGAGAQQWLVLTAGKHTQGWGEMFRVSQRIGEFKGPVTLTVDARTEAPSELSLEICHKHLLYDDGACTVGKTVVQPASGQWQPLTVLLEGPGLSHGSLFAPMFIVFSVAVESSGHSVELDNFRAVDAAGQQLLVNGGFAQGMSRWFFSSDRNHMPWHMKNLALHLLYEQGWVGLGMFALVLTGALWRLVLGNARDHTLAPATAAALVGAMVVGLFDSLLDVPRVAWLIYWLLMLAWILPGASTLGARVRVAQPA